MIFQPAFLLRHGANIVHHSLQRVDENIQVGAVDFTLHEELQVRRAVLGLPAGATFNVEKFGFKRLIKEEESLFLFSPLKAVMPIKIHSVFD